MSGTLIEKTLQHIENFSLTAALCAKTKQMYEHAKNEGTTGGRIWSRAMNLTLTSCSAVITSLGRVALIPFFGMAGVIGSSINFVAKKLGYECRLPTVTDGFNNLAQLLKHATLGIFIMPFIGAVSPQKAAELFPVKTTPSNNKLLTEEDLKTEMNGEKFNNIPVEYHS